MLTKTYRIAVNRVEATTVTIEVSLTNGVMYHFIGLGNEVVREGRSRIAAAIQFNGYKFPHAGIATNMAPADLRKEGSNFDLPLAIAILAANDSTISKVPGQYMMVGKLSLGDTLQVVRDAFSIAIHAREEHPKGLIVPKRGVYEAAAASNLEAYGMDSMVDVVQFLMGAEPLEPIVIDTRKEFYEHQYQLDLDYGDVRGQENVKRASKAVVVGEHNLVMVGPPGSGKSMTIKRLPAILPPPTLAESLEIIQVHNIVDKLGVDTLLIAQHPFRTPHHTISEVTLVDGGSTPRLGETTLAYRGVLFCDESPEFNKSTLEVLRQPLEDRKITILRVEYTTEHPCSFMFVALMNPRLCGYYGDPTYVYVCTPGQIQRYLNKVSGPLLDRIDTQCEIALMPFKGIFRAASGEPSVDTRGRVVAAHAIQIERCKDRKGIYRSTQMTECMIHRSVEPDADGINTLRIAMGRLSLSARAYNRILEMVRIIADLEGNEPVKTEHLAETMGYRSLDRGDWVERQRSRKWV